MKQSKLTEKNTRIPNVSEAAIREAVKKYKERIGAGSSEPARVNTFTILLDALNFDLDSKLLLEWIKSLETQLRVEKHGVIFRRYADSLFGNVLFEFERNLGTTKLREAERQLLEYLPAIERKEGKPFIGIATDGELFRTYTLSSDESGTQSLAFLEQINVHHADPMDFYYWLDRYLLRNTSQTPTSDRFLNDFGPNSLAFTALQPLLRTTFEKHKDEERVKVLFEQWDKYLRIAYGSSVAAPELFVRHTYLATLAKLLAWDRIEHGNLNDPPVRAILEGDYFRRQSIFNFLEEDFFSWLALPKPDIERTMNRVANDIITLLRSYNIRALSDRNGHPEDILKGLYQGLVDPKERHELGEFYTPDWLAELVTRHALEDASEQKVLDPTCGSGTFLYATIRLKRQKLPDTNKTLKHIINNVHGFDIHPVAVIIAKTNYLLALGDLLQKRDETPIEIPVYLANSIVLKKERMTPHFSTVECYKVEIGDYKDVGIPSTFVDSGFDWLVNIAVEVCNDYARTVRDERGDRDYFHTLISKATDRIIIDQEDALWHLAEAMRVLHKQERDTIWAFVIKNGYRPLLEKESYDLIIGNPPWLTLKDISEREYQDNIRHLVAAHDLEGRGHLITHLELAAVYWAHAATLYLKNKNGKVAFVMPRSVFNADQHANLRQGLIRESSLRVSEIWDMNASSRESVSNLFNMPSCVLFGTYHGAGHGYPKQKFPIPAIVLKGGLDEHNAFLKDDTAKTIETSAGTLTKRKTKIYLAQTSSSTAWSERQLTGKSASPYFSQFYEGATLVPRPLWFVKPVPGALGTITPTRPVVKTDPYVRREDKEPKEGKKRTQKQEYARIELSGPVEAKYLFGTLLSTDLIPFAHLPLRPVVIPARLKGNKLEMIDAKIAHKEGDTGLEDWLNDAERNWESKKTAKNKLSVYERLNYTRGITQQNIRSKYRVLYPEATSRLCAAIIQPGDLSIKVGEQVIELRGIVADKTCYFCETNDHEEACYLASILNSKVIEELIDPFMARGFSGAARHPAKIAFEFPIPKFDNSIAEHSQLMNIAKRAEKIAREFIKSNPPPEPITTGLIGNYRNNVRDAIRGELEEIDSIVAKLIK